MKFQDTRAAVSKFIAAQLSDKTQQLLSEYNGISRPSPDLEEAVLTDLNRLLQDSSLYDAQIFTKIKLSEQTQTLLAQNPPNGAALIRLNRLLLADAYPHELVSLSEKQLPDNAKGIETCRENLRQIKRALENYRTDANTEPQWLSELSPQYLNKRALLCPADATKGRPGILTEGATDPTLPCSYLYEFRPDQKASQEIQLEIEGDMLPIARCQHHLFNLSVSGKRYRNGPQRTIYNNSTAKVMKMMSMQTNPSAELPPEVRRQMQEQLSKSSNQVASSSIVRIDPSEDLHTKLKAQFGEAFLESPDGKALLQQLTSTLSAPIDKEGLASLLGKSMPDIALTTDSGKSVKLETRSGKFTLLNIFSINSTPCGPRLQHLEKLIENYDTAQLQAIGISTDDSATAIVAFKQKYQLSMPIWIGKTDQIQTLLNRDVSKPQTKLITFLVNQEMIVKDVFIDFHPEHLSQKVKQFIEAEE